MNGTTLESRSRHAADEPRPIGFESQRVSSIGFSQTLAMGRRATELVKEGRDVISLGLGELDLEIPEPIRTAAAEAAMRGEGRSPPVEGLARLREGISRKLMRDNGLQYSPSEVLVSGGTKQIIFSAMMATLDPQDEVIIPAPYWVSYPDIVRLAGGTPVIVSCGIEQAHKLSAEALEAAITNKTRWIVLNSPNNPTGIVYNDDELRALADVIRRHPRVMVLADEIYENFIYEPLLFKSFASLAPDLKSRTLIVNGFSKSFAMIGWRIGYGAAPADLVTAMIKVQSQVNSGVATIAQAGAIAAIELPLTAISTFRDEYRRRRDRVAVLMSRIPDFPYAPPGGAFYFYPLCDAYIGRKTADGKPIESDVDLAEYLLQTVDVVTVPGSSFGFGPALRLSYTCPESRLDEAFDRIRTALSALH